MEKLETHYNSEIEDLHRKLEQMEQKVIRMEMLRDNLSQKRPREE